MLTISIKGLSDGQYPVEALTDCSKIDHIFEEFFGTLLVSGTMRKHGKRYLLDLVAEASAHLLCDVSGEEFDETIHARFSLEYIANTMLANFHADDEDRDPPFYIRDDDTKIDITDEVRQEMAINLPLKRTAPQYRGKEFADIFPAFTEKQEDENTKEALDPRWAALKSIQFDKK
jgi:uncharacterized metal-binding protein YceD (DUF177 family)